jgi:glycosyltransferase involved in cell wall biosynthesis
VKLSVAVFTRNHADWLRRILPPLQSVADELVVLVNDSTVDDSERVAGEYATRVCLVPHEVVPEHQTVRTVAACRGDWILSLLDDETLSPQWQDRRYVETLLDDKYATHYWIPRRWLLPPGNRFISNAHWYPDFQMRLFRNIPSLMEFPTALHSSIAVAGEPRYLADAWINHWDLVWRDRAAREAKLQEYASASEETLAHYYLFEEQEFESKPADTVVETPPPAEGVDAHCDKRVAITVVDLPRTLRVGVQFAVTIAITNLSNRPLHPGSRHVYKAPAFVSYHWFHAGDSSHLTPFAFENVRHEFGRRLLPGECGLQILPLRAPAVPGEYFLQFDVVEEGVGWFSSFSDIPKEKVTVTPFETPSNVISA